MKWELTLERRAMYYTVYCGLGRDLGVWDRLQKEKASLAPEKGRWHVNGAKSGLIQDHKEECRNGMEVRNLSKWVNGWVNTTKSTYNHRAGQQEGSERRKEKVCQCTRRSNKQARGTT